MECVWNMHGICMNMYEYAWNMHGICEEYAWNMYGICTECAWNPSTPWVRRVRPLEDRVYPIPLTPFPLDPPPAECEKTRKNTYLSNEICVLPNAERVSMVFPCVFHVSCRKNPRFLLSLGNICSYFPCFLSRRSKKTTRKAMKKRARAAKRSRKRTFSTQFWPRLAS